MLRFDEKRIAVLETLDPETPDPEVVAFPRWFWPDERVCRWTEYGGVRRLWRAVTREFLAAISNLSRGLPSGQCECERCVQGITSTWIADIIRRTFARTATG